MSKFEVFLFLPIFWHTCTSLRAHFGVRTNGYHASVNFGVQFKYCRYLCLEKCSSTSKRSADAVEDKSPVPYGFYWRDFYGVPPPDAYALGGSAQNPQTYIGLVYDPAHNGSYVTTIFDGLPYVYNTFDGKTYKITEHIQILCTMDPNKLIWKELTQEEADNLKDMQNVLAGYDYKIIDGNQKFSFHFIAKDSSKPITYVGGAGSINDTLIYAKADGTIGTTNKLIWLLFVTTESKGSTDQKSEVKCGRYFDFTYKLGTIPKFFRNFNLAACSFTCSQGNQNQMDRFKTDKKLKASMEYHWKPKIAFKADEALLAGYSDIYPKLYIAQSFIGPDIYDVGYSPTGSYAYVKVGSGHTAGQGWTFQIFSTTSPEKFEWVNSTWTDFANLDKDLLIPGGGLANGTNTYVGREPPKASTFPGSIHETPEGAFLQSFYNSPLEFQVLMFKG